MASGFKNSDLLNERRKTASEQGLSYNAAQQNKAYREESLKTINDNGVVGRATSLFESNNNQAQSNLVGRKTKSIENISSSYESVTQNKQVNNVAKVSKSKTSSSSAISSKATNKVVPGVGRRSELVSTSGGRGGGDGIVRDAATVMKQARTSLLKSGSGSDAMADSVSYYATATERGLDVVGKVGRGSKNAGLVTAKGIKSAKDFGGDLIAHSKMSSGGVSRKIHNKQMREGVATGLKGGAKKVGSGVAGVGKAGIRKAGSASLGVVESLDDSGIIGYSRGVVGGGKQVAKGVYRTGSAVVRAPYTTVKAFGRAKNTFKAFRKGGLKAGWRTFRKQRKARKLQKLNRRASNVAKRGVKKAGSAVGRGIGSLFRGAFGKIAAIAGGALTPILLIFGALILIVCLMLSLITVIGGSGGSGGLEGDQAIIAQNLKMLGYNNAQVAGIMSNMKMESHYRPGAYQGGGDFDYLTPAQQIRDGGYGLCQWDDRKIGLCHYCDTKGVKHSDIGAQCEYLNNEVHSGVWSHGKADAYIGYFYWDFDTWMAQEDKIENVENLSKTWTWQFERCAAWAYALRMTEQIEEAYRIYNALGSGNDVVARAKSQLGKPYEWGCAGPDSYDCSGLVSYALTGEYVHKWTTRDFITWRQTDTPYPGDICTTGEHCGIYIGNGKMIHAPQEGDVVKESDVMIGMLYVKYGG